ncbi:hypothetical protein B7463_g12133, partial [Scytalidium lignicola]
MLAVIAEEPKQVAFDAGSSTIALTFDSLLLTLTHPKLLVRPQRQIAWNIAKEDGGRTVIYESTSFTVVKDDEEGVEVKVKEFSIAELVKEADDTLKAVEDIYGSFSCFNESSSYYVEE